MSRLGWRKQRLRFVIALRSINRSFRPRAPSIPDLMPGMPAGLNQVVTHTLEFALIAAAFFALGVIGFWLQIEPRGENLIWPPAALSLVVYWSRGLWAVPGIGAGWAVLAVVYHVPWPDAACLAVAQIFEAAFASYWMRSQQFNPRFDRIGDLLDLMFFGGLFAGLAAACVRALGFLAIAGGTASLLIAHRALHWWLADALAILMFAPIMMVWSIERRPGWRWWQYLELALLMAGFAGAAWINLQPAGAMPAVANPLMLYLVVPLAVWAGGRFGAHGASLITLASGLCLLWAAKKGIGPFLGYTVYLRALLEAAFIATVGFTAHGTAALFSERRHAHALLKELEVGFGELLQASSDGFLILDDTGIAQYVNDRFPDLLGVPRERIIGRPCEDFLPVEVVEGQRSLRACVFRKVGLDAVSRRMRLFRGGVHGNSDVLPQGGFYVLTELPAADAGVMSGGNVDTDSSEGPDAMETSERGVVSTDHDGPGLAARYGTDHESLAAEEVPVADEPQAPLSETGRYEVQDSVLGTSEAMTAPFDENAQAVPPKVTQAERRSTHAEVGETSRADEVAAGSLAPDFAVVVASETPLTQVSPDEAAVTEPEVSQAALPLEAGNEDSATPVQDDVVRDESGRKPDGEQPA